MSEIDDSTANSAPVTYKYRRPPPRDEKAIAKVTRVDGKSPYPDDYIDRKTGEIYPETNFEYGEDVRRLAYELWWLRSDRNYAQTERLLKEELGDELPSTPSVATIRKWSKEENWVGKVEDDIKSVARILNERHFLRLFAASEEAQAELIKIALNIHPEKDARRLQVIKDACNELLKLRGIGTAGGYAPPPVPQATVRLDTTRMSPEELSQSIRDAILEEKQTSVVRRKQ